MAWAHCAISSFFLLPSSSSSTIHCRRKTQTLAAHSLPSPPPLKRRKNYLRPKILKTLTKPYISYPQQTTENREEVENLSETLEVDQRDVLGGVGGSNEQKEEVVLEQTVGISDVPEVFSGRLVFEVICYSVLQTIAVYCVIGVVGLFKKSRNGNGKQELKVLGSGIENGVLGSKMENGKENGGFVIVDESQREEKINEIRVMAREARESEGSAKNKNGVVGSSDDVVRVDGNGTVPKIAVSNGVVGSSSDDVVRVDGNGTVSKIAVSNGVVGSSDDDVVRVDGNGTVPKIAVSKDKVGRLKRLEKNFGSLWNRSTGSFRRDLHKVKGFPGRKDNGLSKERSTVAQDAFLKVNGDVIDALDLSVPEKQQGMHSSNDCFQETSNDVVDSKKSSESKAKISRSFKNEVRRKRKFSKLGNKRANTQPDSWWMKLPYVLAIFLRRGPDPQARKGLYSLKMDEGSLSYNVAFEDHSDAKNFCNIMESGFAELDGFSAKVLPLAIKEIESLKSSTKKILVLRKGQLHMYDGQSLEDVEMALRAIVG